MVHLIMPPNAMMLKQCAANEYPLYKGPQQMVFRFGVQQQYLTITS